MHRDAEVQRQSLVLVGGHGAVSFAWSSVASPTQGLPLLGHQAAATPLVPFL